jgi:hypothetical protein
VSEDRDRGKRCKISGITSQITPLHPSYLHKLPHFTPLTSTNYPTSPIISLKIYPTRIFSHHFTRLAFLKISLFSPNLLKIFFLGIFSKYFNPPVF